MNTTARIKQGGKNFEMIVDMEEALKFKSGSTSSLDFLNTGSPVFTDSKKGQVASSSDLKEAFGTENVNEIAEKIVKSGEVLVTQGHRDEEKEKKFKQVIDFLANNSIDPQTGNPITTERIKSALEQSHVNIKNTPMENQINDIVSEISKIIPIKIETKKVKVTVPAIHTGKVYSVVNQYKEKENWLDNGDLEIILKIPSGIIIDFYDKLNSVTHGSALTEEIKENE
jgi:ribosome maturation protein SDO1|tara:strand:+ start:785 stop:1465 length:681 start_codon:yes stop_codon:yes gene_type:complete